MDRETGRASTPEGLEDDERFAAFEIDGDHDRGQDRRGSGQRASTPEELEECQGASEMDVERGRASTPEEI